MVKRQHHPQMCGCGCGRAGEFARGMCEASYQRLRRRETAYGRWQPRVSAEATREHVQRLRAAGLRPIQIAQLAGVDRTTIGNVSREDWETVDAETAAAVLAVEVPDRVADVVDPHARVPIHGAQRRIQSLVAYGYPQAHLARELGINPASSTMAALVGKPNVSNGSTGESITAERERAVRDVFDRLQMVPGPSDRARAHGHQQGWPLPWEWDEDEIDRLDATPIRARRTTQSDKRAVIAEREELVLALSTSHSAAEVAEAVGVSQRSVERIRARLGWRVDQREEVTASTSTAETEVIELTEDEY
ncbi:hypothetical protein AB0H49_34045 [Nocardia sp. NPDC050713]|uniref:hypothetical protein n=1 Tax=Nocardia sp. NPDC050713 TaxID=3154511 RepID=UPI0033D025A5